MWLTLAEALRRLNSPRNVASISPAQSVTKSILTQSIVMSGDNLTSIAPVVSKCEQELASESVMVYSHED